MRTSFDCIVLGLGAMGSAAAYHLSRRGESVLGLDAHGRGHTLGSSHGHSRMIRQAYHQAAEYVPLLTRAYELWRDLEKESGRHLLRITGVLTIGPAGSPVIEGAQKNAKRFGLAFEQLSAEELRRRFPFNTSDSFVGFYEPSGGILRPEDCVTAHLALAARHGARLRFSEPVYSWAAGPESVSVHTNRCTYRASRLVVAAGPWSTEVLGAAAALPLSVRRIVNAHFHPQVPGAFVDDRCPAYLWDVPEGHFYGFPDIPGQGVKFGRHDLGETCTPLTIRRTVDQWETDMLRTVLNRYLPGAGGRLKRALTCMYTLTPDRHFVIERHAHHRQVVYVCGCSGHGFKFSPVIGEILADLAISGATDHPIALFSSRRFSSA
jgi:sarcosine oxidase